MDKPPVLPKNGRRVSSVSLSPHKTRKALKAPLVAPFHAREKSKPSHLNFDVALSKNETVLVTGSGDVLVSRCRYTSKAYKSERRENGEKDKTDDSHSEFWSDCHSVCNPCGVPPPGKGGLLGGAPPQVDVQVDSEPPQNDATELKNDSVDTLEKDDVCESASTPDANETNAEQVGDAPPSTSAEPAQSESKTEDEDNGDDLAVLPSFDYSFFAGENNDMHPAPSNEMECIQEEVQETKIEEKRSVQPEIKVTAPHLMHGVPTFLRSFHQVKITQVSANPLGSHVLLISKEALLFSFGLNDHGQLGHGYQSPVKGPSMGFVTKPSIVTPLLENGGKAVVCSAGVDYSLVVVKTEGKRIERLHQPRNRSAPHRRGSSETQLPIHMERVTSLPSRIQAENDPLERQSSDDSVESMCHYQLYGFGRNDGRKLGLVEPSKRKKGEDVLVPRRVALSCNVWPGTEESDNDLPPPGIFAVAASAHHSAALVRRASGAIELYTWGDATFNALGPVAENGSSSKGKGKNKNRRINGGFTPLPIAVTVPTVVRQLSHSASGESLNGQGIIPVQVALGPTSTFVITSKGKVLSFGKSDTGLLGQGHDVVMTDKPGQIIFPSTGNRNETKISSISVGPSHAVAVSSSGRVFAWGKNEDSKMGFDAALTKHLSRGVRRRGPGGREQQKSPTGATIEWIPREVELPEAEPKVSQKKWIRRKSSENEAAKIGAPPLSGDTGKDRVIRACAGNDMTVFVKESGEVFSCGRSSGRLGLGETGTSAVATPTPMFGGLRLWR